MIPDAAPQSVLRNLRIPRFILPFLLTLVFIVYLPTLNNGFVWDDRPDIIGNPAIQSLAHPSELFASASNRFRPFVNVSFAVDYAIWGERAGGYHATNLLLHVVNVALFYSMTQWYFRRKGPAVLATLWFALFPLNAEAVNSISLGRSYLLVSFLGLSGVMLTRRFVRRRALSMWCLAGVVLMLGLAVMTSEWAVIFPVIFILVGVVMLQRERGSMDQESRSRERAASGRRRLWILGGFAIACSMAGMMVIGTRIEWEPLRWHDALMLVLPVVKSVQLLLFPFPVNLWYSIIPFGVEEVSPSLLWGSWGLTLMACGIGWWLCRHQRVEGWLLLLLLLMLVPVMARLTLFPNPPHPLAARWFYLPSMAWAMFLAAILMSVWMKVGRVGQWIIVTVVGGILLVMAGTVWQRSLDWRTERHLWLATVTHTPDSSWAHLNLGLDYRRTQEYAAALRHLQRAIEIDPQYGKAYYNLGSMYEEVGQPEKAVTAYRRSIGRVADNLRPLRALANHYVEQKRWSDAVPILEQILVIDPTIMEARLNLAVSYQELAEWERAIAIYESAISDSAAPPEAYFNLALALARAGRREEAVHMFDQFLNIAPPSLISLRGRAEQWLFVLRES